MNTALEEFKNKFSPLQLNSFSGIQLLKLLAYPKKTDENIKKQFKDIYEESYNSLKNELEKGMVDYGSGSAGSDINFVLAYRKGEWYNKKRKISLEEAINIANNIRNELVTASKYLDSKNFDGFYDFVSASKSGLFNKGYTHKYLYILYPEYITFYHANSWQIYYKKCFKITNSKNYYDIEKYLLNTYPGCNVGKKSKEFMEKFGIPQKKKDMDNTMNDKDKTPLNQILYGPPGTGKTYNTIIEAMKIIDKNCIEYNSDNTVKNYEIVRENFKKYKALGQIEFVTFHQSYSYEEFVEGIKPDLTSGDLKYEIEKGILKKICENASKKFTNNFDEAYDKFLNEIPTCVEENYYKLNTIKNNKVFGLQLNSNNNLNIHMTENFNKQGVITKENLKKHFENERKSKAWANYYDSIIEHLKNKFGLISEKATSKFYVLIIDEINRGNISKIFGELITLIEEDKRENLSVRLPYSKDVFTVPKNLYIIGTMNTSDRSIASIDIALRRRFKFKEIMPNSNLVADFNCNFKECFEILNKRISVLLDRDHQIGHSYFIEEKYKDSNASELETIWFDSIIPLLNEYFYSDWEKLQALLGNAKKDNTSFIKVVENVSFAKEYSCEEGEMFDFNAKCDFKAAMQNAFGDKFRG